MDFNWYMLEYGKIDRGRLNKKIKIALLSGFTISGLKEVFEVKCAQIGVNASVYEGGYNQYFQEILNEKSRFYEFDSDIAFILIDNRTVLGEYLFFPYKDGQTKRKRFISKITKDYITLVKTFLKNSTGKLVISNLNIPSYSPYGIAEEKTSYGLKDMTVEFNQRIKETFTKESRVFIYDFNSFVSRLGENTVFDYKMYYLGDFRVSQKMLPSLCEDLMGYVKPLLSLSKKCIVLDLDNTLWGGVVGEDGFEGIRLGPEPPGNAYVEFQKRLLALFQRGVILAVNSRNNPEDALKVIREHPYMILREENFASVRINWSDKVSNLRELADEINIGLDSMVYLDDDPVNRELVRKMLPDVLVVDLPEDPSYYVNALMELNCFNIFHVTEDDKKRGLMYSQERRRLEAQSSFSDLKSFLKTLEIKVEIQKANSFSIPRISQLTLRTNQFNLTTKRYQEEKIRELTKSGDFLVYSARVKDKFGDYGITGVVIITLKSKDEWEIDTFLLSCRVLGRGVEKTILSWIMEEAKKAKVKRLVGTYIPTQKNPVCKDFYEDNGFKKINDRSYKYVF